MPLHSVVSASSLKNSTKNERVTSEDSQRDSQDLQDADLKRVNEAWDGLPSCIKEAILALASVDVAGHSRQWPGTSTARTISSCCK